MNQSTNTATTAGGPPPHPMVALREHLTQTLAATSQLQALLSTVQNPGRRGGERR